VRGGGKRWSKRLPLTLTLSPQKSGERECYAFHLPARFSANEAKPSAASGERRLAA
jgi:hypothetical protein